jgi:hypothetical protein
MLRRYVSAFASSAALHAGVIALVVWLFTVGRVPRIVVEKPETPIRVYVLPPEDAAFPGLKPVDRAGTPGVGALADDQRMVSVGGFTFDAGKIADRALVLFPFVSPGVALDHFGLSPPEGALVYKRPRRIRPGEQGGGQASSPLLLSDAALQAVVDKTWARRERWAAFEPIRALTDRYSPNDGRLPELLQRYTDQNALQPYRDKETPDPRVWAQLGIAADHVTFIGFIREYAAEHPNTRATIELLFLLDRIAEANQDALGALLGIDPTTDMQWTREANFKAFQLAVRLRGFYREELSRRGLSSPGALALHYDRVRLDILQSILRNTPRGYRAGDARFLMGAIYWREGRSAEAFSAWRALACDPAQSYVESCRQLSRVIPAGASGSIGDRASVTEINRVLKNEQGRWWDLSYDRLKQFGYRFDAY